MADNLKFAIAVLLVAAGIAGFYLLAEQPMILRILAVLGGVVAGGLVAWFTEPGQRFFIFANEAVTEARKVVWPTRKETMQTTGVVFAFVLLMAVMLWVTDKSVEWAIFDLVLGWKKL